MLRLVCASANPDKVAEIAAILDGVVELLPRPADVPDVVEDADTLEGNARLKAAAICDATGLPAVSRRHRARASTPSAARRASTPPASPARTRRTPTTARSCCASSADTDRPAEPASFQP